MADTAWVIVGRIRRAHGIRGELVVEPITDAPDAVFAPGRRVSPGDAAGDLLPQLPPLEVTAARPFKDGLLVMFDGIHDRNEAERWRDRHLLVRADELEPLAEDEVYIHDLVGLRVERTSGEMVGTVIEVYELPQGLMLEIERGRGSTVLVPFNDAMIERVDVGAQLVVLDPPDGLLDG